MNELDSLRQEAETLKNAIRVSTIELSNKMIFYNLYQLLIVNRLVFCFLWFGEVIIIFLKYKNIYSTKLKYYYILRCKKKFQCSFIVFTVVMISWSINILYCIERLVLNHIQFKINYFILILKPVEVVYYTFLFH